jgi:aspartyl-tRNA(Asn)/glutamyl-tRNA(Gln) amidotransferase subunit A
MTEREDDAMAEDNLLSRREAARLLGVTTVAGSASQLSAASVDLSTACGIADAIRKRAASAVEVLETYIKRIEKYNPKLNAFVWLDLDSARKRAREIDEAIRRGEDPGPLAGVPFGIKDLEDCAGMPTSKGSLLYKGRPPVTADFPHIGRVRKAGAVMLGKTAAPEFGLSSITSSRAWGVTRNPWDPTRSPGGSSGGAAAAVSSGMIPLGSGTDGGGSIRSPGAFTGLVGLKPSHGRIGRAVTSDISCHGCLSLTVRDTARYLDVTAGPSPNDRMSLPPPAVKYEQIIETLHVAGLKAAWSPDFGFIPTETECIDVARKAAEKIVSAAKLQWVDKEFRSIDPVPTWGFSAITHILGDLELEGVWPSKAEQLTERLQQRMQALRAPTPSDLSRADQTRRDIEVQTAKFFEDVDVLFSPVTTLVSIPADGPVPATIAGRDARSTGAEAHLMMANFCWLPAISVPAGSSSSGFPIGLQIVCRRWRDDIALRLARIFEQAQPWPHKAPGYREA